MENKIILSYLSILFLSSSFSQAHEFGIITGLNNDLKGKTKQNIGYVAEYSSAAIYGLSYNYFLKRKLINKSAYSAANFISTNVLINKKGYVLLGRNNTVPNEIYHKSYFIDLSVYFQHHFFGKETFSKLNGSRFVLYGGIGLYSSFNISNQEESVFITELRETNSSNNLFGLSSKIDIGYRYKQFTFLLSPIYTHFFQTYSDYFTDNSQKINLMVNLRYKLKKVIKK